MKLKKFLKPFICNEYVIVNLDSYKMPCVPLAELEKKKKTCDLELSKAYIHEDGTLEVWLKLPDTY